MKAEHRKELETNTLADRMGRLLETAKQKPQGSTMLWILFGVAVVVVSLFAYRWYDVGKAEKSEGWYLYYLAAVFDADEKALLDSYAEQTQGRAVRFERAWRATWAATKKLGVDPKGARDLLNLASKEYDRLREECEGDPVLAPEAIYSLAVIEETLSVEDRMHLNRAIDYYEDVSKKFPQSAYGQLAKNRLEILNSDEGRKEVNMIYQDLQNLIRLDRFDRKN